MPVRIQEINVQNLGPIEHFSMKLGNFNLIYGRNEKGKTYLVEFLIRSLFRNVRRWQLRSLKGTGKVRIEGLEEKAVDFSPTSSLKMEDFWDKNPIGLPPDFSKLLVVKGAEVELADADGGIDKKIVKGYLSSQEILDTIGKKISPTIQRSTIQNGIIGDDRGEIKERKKTEKELNEIDQLFDQINRGYSGGTRKRLDNEKEELERQLNQQELAKQHLAFSLDQEIKDLDGQKALIDEKTFQNVRENTSLYKQKHEEHNRKKEEQQKAEEKSLHYMWLKNACDYYNRWLSIVPHPPTPLFLILSISMALLTGLFVFLQIPLGAALALWGVLLFGFLYIRKIQILSTKTAEAEELKNLKKEFEERFQRKLSDIAVMQELLQNIEEDYNTSRLLKKQLTEDLKDLSVLKLEIGNQIYELTGKRIEPEFWNEAIRKLEIRRQELGNQIEKKKIQLAGLGVNASDYAAEKPEFEYSKQQYNELREKLNQINSQIEEERQKLATLKQLVCQKTSDNIAVNWEVLIQNLRDKRQTVLSDYKQKTAEILGKIAVHRVLEELRKDEDKKIVEGLRSKAVLVPLSRITKRYNNFDLEGEKLIVSDPYHNFYLHDLSTGAQEQILLALRIGFSVKILKQESLFLILDDAFQYSDWERREHLMDITVDLAKSGWQIIYLTMDDHIKSLFDKKGTILGDQYRIGDLEN